MDSAKSSATKRKRPTIKDALAEVEPFDIPAETLKPTKTWVEEAVLEKEGIKIYQGTFRDPQGQAVDVPMIQQELVDYSRSEDISRYLERADLHNFFTSRPSGVDTRRVYELATCIQKDGKATLTAMDGEKVEVQITPQLIADALKLNNKGSSVRETRDAIEVYGSKKQNATYGDMADQRAATLC
ncbi:hypothetical protein [Enterobacter cloacae complex sp. GF14B]|uniref:hypothetical protein n=1 Tax=Enterobacter cloacae complex sp. GF14B TaxID=2511982 RepID=UPI00100DF0C4|nr:hypothetical protein [Enterobacter cloacae complex sp. GF14B]RYA43640.1 hypothetical protein DD606_25280 [Enterobacter cloacae complex sp. GF14B]